MDIMTIEEFDLNHTAVMEHMYAVTTLSPKLSDLLRCIILRYEKDAKHSNIAVFANTTLSYCEECVKNTKQKVFQETGIPVDLLNRSAIIYSVHDAVIIAASIRETIEQWKLSFALAYYESRLAESRKIYHMYSVLNSVLKVPDDLPVDDMIVSLNDCAEDMQAWLEIELADETEDYELDPDNHTLDCFYDIIGRLQLLAEEIEKTT